MLTTPSLGKRQPCSLLSLGYTLQYGTHPSSASNGDPSPCFSLLGWDTGHTSQCGDYGMTSSLSCLCRLVLVSVLSCWVTKSLGVKLKGCPSHHVGSGLGGSRLLTCVSWEAVNGPASPYLPVQGGHFSKYRRKEICEWILQQQEAFGCLCSVQGLASRSTHAHCGAYFRLSASDSQVISTVGCHCTLQQQGGSNLLNVTLLEGDSWLIPGC